MANILRHRFRIPTQDTPMGVVLIPMDVPRVRRVAFSVAVKQGACLSSSKSQLFKFSKPRFLCSYQPAKHLGTSNTSFQREGRFLSLQCSAKFRSPAFNTFPVANTWLYKGLVRESSAGKVGT